jgi:HEAT repeat protein
VMDDELAGKLVGIIQSDAGAELRGSAAIALGPALEEAFEVGFDDELDNDFDIRVLGQSRVVEIQRVLRSMHDDEKQPSLVRRMCLEASVRAPQDWHPAAVLAAHQRSDKDWKMTALFCMGRLPGFEAEILEALSAADSDIVVEAVRSAGLSELNAAGPVILDLAASETPEPRVRCAAVEALALLETEGIEELLVSLTESDDESLAQAAFESLEERRVFSDPPDSY